LALIRIALPVPTVNRRTFLQSTGLAATNAAVGTGRAGAEEENPFLSIALAVSFHYYQSLTQFRLN
jgi:hypothetical protein